MREWKLLVSGRSPLLPAVGHRGGVRLTPFVLLDIVYGAERGMGIQGGGFSSLTMA